MKTFAIIPAGGKGTRSGLKFPKQYLKFNGKELIVYALEVFQKNKLIDEIIIPADPSYFILLEKLKKKYRLTKLKSIIPGGKERQDSVYKGLLMIKAKKDDLIVVHDAVRPLLPSETLTKAINTAKRKGNAVVCLKAKDTLIKGKRIINEYLNRNEVYYVQTPQIFKYQDLKKAMDRGYKDNFVGTDESMLAKRVGIKVNIVEGSPFNFKVTSKEDIEMFKRLKVPSP